MKKIVSYILVFFLSLVVCLSCILNVFKNEVFDYNSVISKLEKNNYYNKAYISVNNHFENIIEQSGLDKSVLENIVTNDKIKQDINESIKNVFEGKEYKVEVSTIKENLNNNIDNYLKESKRIVNNKERQSLDEFVEKIASLYEEDVFPNSIISKFSKTFLKVSELLNFAIKMVYVCIAVITILLLLVNIKNIFNAINYVGVTLMSSAVLLIIPKIIESTKLELNKLNVINVNISSVISSITLDVISKLMCFAIVAFIIGIVLTVISNVAVYAKDRK